MEDRLRDTGLEVVRWGFRDVRLNAPTVVEQIEAAWERGELARLPGRPRRLALTHPLWRQRLACRAADRRRRRLQRHKVAMVGAGLPG